MGRASKFVKGAKSVKGPHHEVPKPDRYCVQCKREFVRPSEYQRHLEETLLHNPTGARKFPCDLCPKSFTQKYNLDNHKYTHSRSGLVTCNLPLGSSHSAVCRRQYADLRAHIYRSHLKAFRSNGLPVPAWLKDAVAQRLDELKLKRKTYGTTRKSEGTSSELSTPSDSPLATPSPKFSHSIQVFNAHTMQPLHSEPITAGDHLSTRQSQLPGSGLLDLLNHDVTFTGSTVPPEQHPFISTPSSAIFDQSNIDMAFGSVPMEATQFHNVPETSAMGAEYTPPWSHWLPIPAANIFPDVGFGSSLQPAYNQCFFNAHAPSLQHGHADYCDILGQQVRLSLHNYNPPQFYNNNMGNSAFHFNC